MAVGTITKAMVSHPAKAQVKGKSGELEPLVPASGHALFWDDSPGLGGFGIRVSAQGRVSYILRYWHPATKREQWMTLDKPSEVFTLTAAKKKAREILRDVGGGKDPVADARAVQVQTEVAKGLTVDRVAQEWLDALPTAKSKRKRRFAPRTIESYTLGVAHLREAFGARPLGELTSAEISTWHRTLTKKSGPYAANRALDVLGVFLAWCRRNGKVERTFDPAADADEYSNVEQKRGALAAVRLTVDQEARLLRAIFDAMKVDPVGATALLVLWDTGRRKSEVLGMRWDRLDTATGVYALGASKGVAEGDAFFIHARELDAIRALPRIVGNPHIFTGVNGGRRAGLQSRWEAVKRSAGLEEWSTELGSAHLHDLRHNRVSQLLGSGVPVALVQRQAGWSDLAMLGTYGHVTVARDVAPVLSQLPQVQPAAPATEVLVPMRGKKK